MHASLIVSVPPAMTALSRPAAIACAADAIAALAEMHACVTVWHGTA